MNANKMLRTGFFYLCTHTMRRLIIIIIIFLIACTHDTKSRIKPPACTPPTAHANITDSIPETVYSFYNGRSMALWKTGAANDSFPGDIIYTGCMLTECETSAIVDSWDTTTSCTLEMSGDTLIIKRLSMIALSPGLGLIHIPWLTTRYFYHDSKLVSSKTFNTEIHYTPEQVETAFSRLDTSKWGNHRNTRNGKQAEQMMRFASQMMVAAISGNTEAEKYFYLFKKRFRPENEYAIWFEEMEDILYYSRFGKERRAH